MKKLLLIEVAKGLADRASIPPIKKNVWYGEPGRLCKIKNKNKDLEKYPRTGILLVHGFGGTPREMHDCGVKLSERGFRCLSITLSGHGKDAKDLTDAKMEDWIKDILRGVASLRRDGCRKIWIIGYSLGSPLAVHYTLKHGGVSGLVLFSPYLSNLWFYSLGSRIFKLLEKELFIKLHLQTHYLRYSQVPLSSAAQAIKAFEPLSKGPIHIDVPIMMVHGKCDEFVNEKDSRAFFDRLQTKNKKFLVADDCDHAIVINIKDSVMGGVAEFIKKNTS